MSQMLDKSHNELVIRRRRKQKVKKLFMLFIMLVSLLITLCLKLPYFNIKNIQVSGNKNISTKDIVALSNVKLGNNIFYIDLKDGVNGALSNPYISSATIIRKFPSTILINVKEREAVFYNNIENQYFVVDKDGIVLQKRDNIKDMKLIKLDGFDYSKCEVGKVLKDNDKSKVDAVVDLGEIVRNNKVSQGITLIDVSNSVDIKVYYGQICVKFGNTEDIGKKFNKVLNILERKELQGVKGYIDVSFNGNPVFFIEK
ncbi:FtsQ-type POTRA domain-containing protein [Clostridiaceae bacterium UIB06]|uniref:FtsQ-type POTRA domain-containing protein n=1 Tax=Clostridium thailandense TaxID=2794346 RepID=A0A949TLE6_9CLOT|nr:FtsQ-type POTRA domain-containing protein [Clostridium thailandense]MBV7275019.1 FtsQ-type POTRA domain-containing protein [Clostridium thailandense]MCH5136533.1 FtsQ-type POTRA domain-containing protein [Clostridiaceae bacterium UIB06]